MAVKRVVTNIRADNLAAAKAFYGDILGMDVAMDLGWIVTFTADATMVPQLSVATEGGSGTAVPDISVEVDDLDHLYDRMIEAGIAIAYGPASEPLGCATLLRARSVRPVGEHPQSRVMKVVAWVAPRESGGQPRGRVTSA